MAKREGTTSQMALTPCTGDCKLDSKREFCVSCYRTLHEIAVWRNLPDKEKERLMHEVAQRGTAYRQAIGK